MTMFKRVEEENSVIQRVIHSNTAVIEVRERQIEKSNKEFHSVFDQAMKDQFKEYKKIDKRLDSYETLMEKIQYTTEKYRQDTKDQVRDIINDVVKK